MVRRRRHQAVHVPRIRTRIHAYGTTLSRGIQQGYFYRSGEASTTSSDNDETDLDEGDEPDAATIDRSGNAAFNRLEAAVARIERRESRGRTQRIRRDILVARRIRGGYLPATVQAWGALPPG